MILSKLQENFIEAVRRGKDDLLIPEIKQRNVKPGALINIYRHSTYSIIFEALKLTFPTALKVIGEKEFKNIAADFIYNNPPKSGNLDDYGADFPEALEGDIKELAKFEWNCHLSGIAGKPETLDLVAISKLTEEQYFNIIFKLQEHVKIFTSNTNVYKIWQESLGEKVGKVPGDGKNIIISRPEGGVLVEPVSDAEGKFLGSINAGKTLYESFEAAEAVDSSFNLDEALKKHIMKNTFRNFTVGE